MSVRFRASWPVIVVSVIMPRFAPASEAAPAPTGVDGAAQTLVVLVAPPPSTSPAPSSPRPPTSGDAQASSTRELVSRAAKTLGLGEPRLAPVAAGSEPRAPGWLASAQRELAELAFAAAINDLDAAVTEVALTGANGLSARELDDLFLLRAVAALRLGEATRTRAWEDFIRAAALAPERVLDAGRFAPAALETWERAMIEVRRRPRGALTVHGPTSARVFVDARPAVAAPAVIAGLAFGEHYLRIEEVGRVPWATTLVLAQPAQELEVPQRGLMTLDDRSAAELGRRAGARFVLLVTAAAATPSSGEEAQVEMTLIRVADASRRDSALARLGQGDEPVASAMRRLLEAERPPPSISALSIAPRSDLDGAATRPQPTGPRWWFWAGGLAVVVGAVIVTALVARDGGGAGSGFSVTADPRRSGP